MSLFSSNAPASNAYLRGPANGNTQYTIGTSMGVGTEKDAAYDVYHPAMKWDLSSIPSGSRVESAALEMYLSGKDINTTHYVQVWRFIRSGIDWGDVTWNQYDDSANLNWGTQGGSNTSTDVDTNLGQLQFTSGSANGKYTFTLDADEVEKWFWGGKQNYGILLKASIEDWDVVGVARGTLTVWRGVTYGTADERPTLKITYHAGGHYWIMGCGFGGRSSNIFQPGKYSQMVPAILAK